MFLEVSRELFLLSDLFCGKHVKGFSSAGSLAQSVVRTCELMQCNPLCVHCF